MLHRVRTLHTAIANDICPNGEAGYLECRTCGNEVEITPEDVAHFLRSGWPRCCERTMRWEQPNGDTESEESK